MQESVYWRGADSHIVNSLDKISAQALPHGSKLSFVTAVDELGLDRALLDSCSQEAILPRLMQLTRLRPSRQTATMSTKLLTSLIAFLALLWE